MHPIERLRAVARASGAPQRTLVVETAAALSAIGADPRAMVMACRRVVSRQPGAAALVWFAARVLTAADPQREVEVAQRELVEDRTAVLAVDALPDDAAVVVLGWPDELAAALPRRGDLEVLVVDVHDEAAGLVDALRRRDVAAVEVPMAAIGGAVGAADVVVLEATALGPDGLVSVAGSLAAAAVARHLGVSVWAVVGVGRALPEPMWHPFLARALPDDDLCADDEIVPLDLIDQVIGPAGPVAAEARVRSDRCPVAPELFRGDVI